MNKTLTISPVSPEQIPQVSRLAHKIWWEHFKNIVSDDQITYMLKNLQSPEAINRAINEEGYVYYAAIQGGGIVGYSAAKIDGDRIFLSKLYVDAPHRKQGIARAFIWRMASDLGAGKQSIYLHCNRQNIKSLDAYACMGFLVKGELDTDIGSGFFARDYVLELPLTGAAKGLNIRGVIFDMDGLLFDSERLYQMGWREVGRQMGYSIPPEITENTLGLGFEETERIFQQYCGREFTFKEAIPRLTEWVSAYISEREVPVKPGARQLLSTLQARGIKRAVGSSNHGTVVDEYLNAAKMTQCFDVVVSGDMVENAKPAPDIFLRAAEEMGLRPNECMVLEDSPAGILAAHRAGCLPVMVPDLVQPEEETLQLLWRMLSSLEQVEQILF